MRRTLNSAAYRIAFTYSAAFALAILALGLVVYFLAHAAFVHQLDARIEADSVELRTNYRQEGPGELREAIAARDALGLPDELGYALFDANGRRIAGALDTPMPGPGWRNIVFVDPREGNDPARALAVDLGDGTRLVVAADREPLEAIDRTVLTLFGIAFAIMLIMGAAGALLLGGYLRSRIGRIGATADAIISGDLSRRMPIGPRDDEFDRLSRTLNVMLDRIAALLDNLRQVSSDVAHDLRTPLARLRNQLERIQSSPADATPREEALQKAIEQSDEVLALFAAILRISEVEGGGVRKSFGRVDMSALVTELCESYAPAIEDGGRSIQWSVDPAIAIEGDRELIAQAIVNLLENAQLHTPTGAAIQVGLTRATGKVSLTVADNGPGVPAGDRARITQRFTRLEASRSTTGHGLGLSLVAAIAAVHDSSLEFEDNRPGLAVRLRFPDR